MARSIASRLLAPADARGHRGPRIRVVEDQLDQRRKAKAQAVAIGGGELVPQCFVQSERSFEVGAGRSPLDTANALAQIEPAALAFGRREQPLQTASQVRRLADIRLAALCASQHEHGCARRSGGEEFSIAFGNKVHAKILVDSIAGMRCRISMFSPHYERTLLAPLV